MSDMKPPPPRYRIVEHKGRLISTDTWAEGRPTRSDTPLPRISGSPGPGRPRVRSEPASGGIDALGAALVLAVCGGSVDPAGQPILSTRSYFDINGPREIVLSPANAQRLGRWLARALAILVFTIILLCIFPQGLFPLVILFVFGASGANSAGRPAITRWLDRLGED
ncbi:MAG: hypothetical protein ABI240_06335 [Sphingomonas sp.]